MGISYLEAEHRIRNRTLILIKSKVKINQLIMNQYIIDTIYKVIGIGLMGLVIVVGVIGFVRMLKGINKLKDTE
jgi:uncharacterized membrane protein